MWEMGICSQKREKKTGIDGKTLIIPSRLHYLFYLQFKSTPSYVGGNTEIRKAEVDEKGFFFLYFFQ